MDTLITIRTQRGDKLQIDATVIGKFAVHTTVGYDDGTYTVTHVALGQCIRDDLKSQDEAEDLAQRLDAAIVEDITPERVYSKEYKAFAKIVRSALLNGRSPAPRGEESKRGSQSGLTN